MRQFYSEGCIVRLAEVAFAVKAFRGNSELTLTLPSLPGERSCPGLGSGPVWSRLAQAAALALFWCEKRPL